MNRKGISTVAVVVIVVVAVVVAAVGTYFALREEKEPANLGVANIDVPQVQQGETATVEVLITNSGGKEGSKSFELVVDGESIGVEEVTLAPGETVTISFDVTKDEPGSYEVSIGGETATLSVGVEPIRMAVVTDIGGRGDLSFNDMAIRGATMAKNSGYVSDFTTIISNKESDYLPNLRGAARSGNYDLIVGVGFLLSGAMKTVANEFPDQNFALVDAYPSFEEGDPGEESTLGLFFKAEQPSALVGALAGMLAAHYDRPNTGMALGIEIPVLWDFEAGYKWGVNWGLSWLENNHPEALEGEDIDDTPIKDRVLWTYTGTFSDPAAGYNAAQSQFGQGAVACYNVGGPIGLGIFRAAEEIHNQENIPIGKPPFGIGVDANQDWVRPGYIIASGVKRVDVGVTTAAQWVAEGTFREKIQEENGVWVGGMKNNAVGISDMSSLETFLEFGIETGEITYDEFPEIKQKVRDMRDAQPDWVWEGVNELKNRILNDEVTVPPAATSEEIQEIRNKYG